MLNTPGRRITNAPPRRKGVKKTTVRKKSDKDKLKPTEGLIEDFWHNLGYDPDLDYEKIKCTDKDLPFKVPTDSSPEGLDKESEELLNKYLKNYLKGTHHK